MAAKRFQFTKKALESLEFDSTGKFPTYHDIDKNAHGLQCRVGRTSKTFQLHRRVNGKPERIRLGTFPEMTVEQARKAAAAMSGEIVRAVLTGGDSPNQAKRRAIAEAKTLQQAFDDYMQSRKSLKDSTRNDMRRSLNDSFGDLMGKPLTKITADMVKKRHAEHGKRSESRANLGCRYLRAVFNFAMGEYTADDGRPIVEHNPVRRLSQTRAWFKIDRRENFLTETQISPWWNAVGQADEAVRDYYQFTLLTGLRASEGAALCWENVDLVRGTFTVRDTKNKRDHVLPLSDFLWEMLKRRAGSSTSNYVFGSDNKPLPNVRYWQGVIREAAGVMFITHDLRRSFVTIAERLDFPFSVLKRLMNHSEANNVTMGYIGSDVERLREPMQRITDFVLKAAGVKSAEVVAFPVREQANV